MIKELEGYINQANKNELQFLLCFYKTFNNIEYDPISIEVQFEYLRNSCETKKIDHPEEYFLKLTSMIKEIDYDFNTKIIRLLPKHYIEIISCLKKKIEVINQKIINFSNEQEINQLKSELQNVYSHGELIIILKSMYENAPEGYQMTMIHLFGIKYSKQLKNKKVKEIAIAATGKASLYVEIGKGIKLANYVEILKEIPLKNL